VLLNLGVDALSRALRQRLRLQPGHGVSASKAPASG